MKKLGICLLAFAMVLGFVSCQKDAETKKKNVWSEKTIYIHGDDFYFDQEDAEAHGYGEDDDLCFPVFVCNNPGFTGFTRLDTYDMEGEYKDVPFSYQDDPAPFVTDLADVFNYTSCGIFKGTAILYWGAYYSLNKEGATEKTVFAFDDGSSLTIYYHEPEESPE